MGKKVFDRERKRVSVAFNKSLPVATDFGYFVNAEQGSCRGRKKGAC
jgi:hypothetical protein